MMIPFKRRKWKKYGTVLGTFLILGLALSGFFEFRQQLMLEAPVVNLDDGDIAVKPAPDEVVGSDLPVMLQPALSAGIIEEMIYSDKLLAEYRMERQRLRGQETALLQEILQNSEADSAMKEQASLRLIDIMEKEENEIRMEYLLKSSGTGDCVVMLQGEEITVLLPVQLEESRTADICQHISRITSIPEEQIHIVMREETDEVMLHK